MNLTKFLSAVLLSTFVFSASQSALAAGRVVHANDANPGAEIELNNFLSKQDTTLLFIHSPHCGPCKKISPKIDALARKKPDIKIVDVLLDSKKDKGIGWDSPVAKQFDIHSVPEFRIYDKDGQLKEKGKPAEDQVDDWLVEYKLQKKEK